MLTPVVAELTRPTNSWMIFGLFPAALTTLGEAISVGIGARIKGRLTGTAPARRPRPSREVTANAGSGPLGLTAKTVRPVATNEQPSGLPLRKRGARQPLRPTAGHQWSRRTTRLAASIRARQTSP